MYWDGIKCKRTRVFSYRLSNPATDVNLRGEPIKDNYVVIVRISDCPTVEKDGRKFYTTDGVPQAFPMDNGGTNYGYAKSVVVKDAPRGRWVIHRTADGMLTKEWSHSYRKTPMYVVKDGAVYVGAIYRELEKVKA